MFSWRCKATRLVAWITFFGLSTGTWHIWAADVTTAALKGLDLAQPPSVAQIMAAGQLGGELYPTHAPADTPAAQQAGWEFARIIERWNRHEYREAVEAFRNYAATFPDSPWRAEALLHVGCDATYHGRYTEAETLFADIITATETSKDPGARMMCNKARQRLALVKYAQNNFTAASRLFAEVFRDSPDWRLKTYAAHWIQRLSRLSQNRQAMLNCGRQALAAMLKARDPDFDARQLAARAGATDRGQDLDTLARLAAEFGFDVTGLRLAAADLPRLPLPAIVHLPARTGGDSGHYWLLEQCDARTLELFDPQSRQRFQQTPAEFVAQWDGVALVLAQTADLPGQRLAAAAMAELWGGCCGAPKPEDNTGCPGDKSGRPPQKKPGCCKGCGAPDWDINLINLNLYVVDVPLWYHSPAGPDMRMILSYNSESALQHYEPFGNKWSFAFLSYLVVDTAGNVTVFMPDGRRDQYLPAAGGGYEPPFRGHNTLTRVAENHFTLRLPDDSVYTYQIPPGSGSQQPFMTEMRDPHGLAITMGFNTNVQLVTITDAFGRTNALAYNAQGLVSQIADPFGRRAGFEYDGQENLTNIVDMAGYATGLTYDNLRMLTSMGNAESRTLILVEPADGVETEENFNAYPPPGAPMWENARVTVTDGAGGREEFFYYAGCYNGACGGMVWHVLPNDYVAWESPEVNNDMPTVPKTWYYLGLFGNQDFGEIVQADNRLGGHIWFEIDPDTGDRTAIEDSLHHKWHFQYNSRNLPTRFMDPMGNVTRLGYATNGVDLVSISNFYGAARMAYTPQRELAAAGDFLAQSTRFGYNELGQFAAITNPAGDVVRFTYDPDHRLQQVTLNGQPFNSYTYDAYGRISTFTDAAGWPRGYQYNGLNEITNILFPDGRGIRFRYSACCPHQLEEVIARDGRQVLFQYDRAHRLTRVTHPDQTQVRMAYDANGNLTEWQDPNGRITRFYYNSENLVTQRWFSGGIVLAYDYNEMGLLLGRRNARGTRVDYQYDGNYNIKAVDYADDTPDVSNQYDRVNRLVKIWAGNQLKREYTYNANGWLVNNDGPFALDTFTYQYDALGRITNMFNLRDYAAGYAFNAAERIAAAWLGTNEYDFAYAGASPWVQAMTRPDGTITETARDPLGRVTNLLTRTGAGAIVRQYAYTYSSNDWRLAMRSTNDPAYAFPDNQRVFYTYDAANRMTASTPPLTQYAYDADGNMTRWVTPSGLIFHATYDAENRLTSLIYTSVAVRITHTYDYAGGYFVAEQQRYRALLLEESTRYLRSGRAVLQELDRLDAVTRSYLWGPGLTPAGGVGGLLAVQSAGTNYSVVCDGVGNVTAILAPGPQVAADYRYDPLGRLLARGGGFSQPYQFSTKPYNDMTGLYDFGYRFYEPVSGRWLNRDPILESGGVNLYQYSLCNPMNYVDEDGRFAWWAVAAGVVGAGMAAYENHADFACGRISGGQYAALIAVNGVVGGVSALVPGWGGVAAGAASAALGDLFKQALTAPCLQAINPYSPISSAAMGALGGVVGMGAGAFSKWAVTAKYTPYMEMVLPTHYGQSPDVGSFAAGFGTSFFWSGTSKKYLEPTFWGLPPDYVE